MELVRYKPGEAIRWLETGAADSRKNARTKGRALTIPEDVQSLTQNVKSAAGALLDLGRSAMAEILHTQAMASEFVLQSDSFEIVKPNSTKKVFYKDVKSLEQKGDKVLLHLEKGAVTIKPYAYVVAGRLRVPIGWTRNGIEVPFDLLIEELSARCGIETA